MKPENRNTTDKEVSETKAEVSAQRQTQVAMSRFLFKKGNPLANVTDESSEEVKLNILPWRKRR